MDIDSEVVGKNFLYMLTEDKYAAMLKDAFNALPADEQAYFQPTIDEMESEASDLGLGADGKYALAWIKLWVGSYNAQTDDGPICNTLVTDSATDQCGLLVYNKFRSVEESAGVSVMLRLQLTRMAIRESAVMDIAITSLSLTTALCPGLPAPSSPT